MVYITLLQLPGPHLSVENTIATSQQFTSDRGYLLRLTFTVCNSYLNPMLSAS